NPDKNVQVNSQEEALEVLGKALEDSPLKRWITPPEPEDPSVPHVFHSQNRPSNDPPIIKKVLTPSRWRQSNAQVIGCSIPIAVFMGFAIIASLIPQPSMLWLVLIAPAWLVFNVRKANKYAKTLAENGQVMLGEVTDVKSGEGAKVEYRFVSPQGDIIEGHVYGYARKGNRGYPTEARIKAGQLVWVVYLDDETHGLA
ncbi:MAG: hypothetical protein AAF267_24355, partial [Deinococcota bacterium]